MPQTSRPAVVFDLDGTLADTIELIVASYQHAYTSVLGHSVHERDVRRLIGQPLMDTFAARDPDHAEELQGAYVTWNLANAERLTRRYPGVSELVDRLDGAGRTLGVVTSKRRRTAELALRGVGLAGRIPLLATLEDTTRHKPDPEPLLLGAERLGVAPGECVYVGDAVVDVRAARAAGMGAVAVAWGAGEPDALAAAGADAVVHDVAALGEVLLGRGAA